MPENGARHATDYRFKKGELFKRIKPTAFAELVVELAHMRLSSENPAAPAPDQRSPERDQDQGGSRPGTGKSVDLLSVISGVGAMDLADAPVSAMDDSPTGVLEELALSSSSKLVLASPASSTATRAVVLVAAQPLQ